VQVSGKVVGGALGAFAVMIAVIAFLLGRESTRHERRVAETTPAPVAALPEPPSTPPESTAPTAGATPPAEQQLAPTPVPAPAPHTDPLPASPSPSPPPTTAHPAAPARSQNASAIRDYFIRMDSIQAAGMGDTQEVASKLLTGAMRGDTSGIDQIVSSVDASITKVKAITPPPECAGYHAKMLDLLGQSEQLVRSLKSVMASQDTGAIAGIAMTGDAIKTKTEALEAEGKAIRARAGL
jgi:hypothetical protein